MNSAAAVYRSWVIDRGGEIFVQSSGMQDALEVYVELTAGGGFMHFSDCYTETGSARAGTLFQVHDLKNQSTLQVTRFRLGAPFDLFLDVGNVCKVLVDGGLTIDSAAKILRALPESDPIASPIRFNNVVPAAYALDPRRFELNQHSRPKLTVDYGGDTYHGGKVWHGMPAQLASFTQGAEPASPIESEILWNATTHRPRVRTDTAHRDLAFADDSRSLNGLLKNFAALIVDPRVYKTRSIVGGELDAIGDLVHPGTSATAPGSRRRPTWNASSDAFGGRPTFTCSNSADKMLHVTLGTPIPVGSYPGAFVVARATTPNDKVHRRRFFTSMGSEYWFAGFDIDSGPTWQAKYTGSIVQQWSSTNSNADQYAHAFAVTFSSRAPHPGSYLMLSLDTVSRSVPVSTDPHQNDPGGTVKAIKDLCLGAIDRAAGAGHCADVEIAYLALLHTTLPASVLAQTWDLADAEWSLGL